jgi:hypothetical protein
LRTLCRNAANQFWRFERSIYDGKLFQLGKQ